MKNTILLTLALTVLSHHAHAEQRECNRKLFCRCYWWDASRSSPIRGHALELRSVDVDTGDEKHVRDLKVYGDDEQACKEAIFTNPICR